jgi:hypothetical protein
LIGFRSSGERVWVLGGNKESFEGPKSLYPLKLKNSKLRRDNASVSKSYGRSAKVEKFLSSIL